MVAGLPHVYLQYRTHMKETKPTFESGDIVRISGGVFMGIEGTVKKFDKLGRMVRLHVDLIGQSVAVDVDQDFIRLVTSLKEIVRKELAIAVTMSAMRVLTIPMYRN